MELELKKKEKKQLNLKEGKEIKNYRNTSLGRTLYEMIVLNTYKLVDNDDYEIFQNYFKKNKNNKKTRKTKSELNHLKNLNHSESDIDDNDNGIDNIDKENKEIYIINNNNFCNTSENKNEEVITS